MKDKANPKPIVLAGYPGAGKTTVGAILAHRLQRRFKDGDAGIMESAGMSVMEIFDRQGEAGFRAWERKFYLETPLTPDTVLAVGGGALLDAEVRAYLEDSATVICMTVQPRVAWQRLRHDYPRPLLAGTDGLQRLERLWKERAWHYESYSIRLDTTELTPEQAADEIIKLIDM